MIYAAAEIVFWIILAAIVGGGIGYGLNEAKSVQLGKRLTASRADAPMERELATAWDTIEDLNRRLQVAHETIRSGITAEPVAAADNQFEAGATADSTENAAEDTADETANAAEDDNRQDDGLVPFDRAPELAAPLVHTVEELVPTDELEEDAADGAVGSRLSDRVASASIGNQVEVIKTIEF